MHLYTALGFGSIAAVVVGLSVLMLRRSAAKDGIGEREMDQRAPRAALMTRLDERIQPVRRHARPT